jgi:anti-sigma regulatory factor (Ser/Thr protein kinase)
VSSTVRLPADVDPAQSDRIRLTVPATATAVRIIRVGASAIATRAGFTYREADELRLAVGEAAAVLARSARNRGDIVVTYVVRPEGLDADLRLRDDDSRVTEVSEVSGAILQASVDRWEVIEDGRGLALHKARSDLDDTDFD